MKKTFILGVKDRMSQIFDDRGFAVPVTVINISDNTITQVKTSETKDGYAAVQVATGDRREKTMTKAVLGHLKKPFRFVREFRTDVGDFTLGDIITMDVLSEGDEVQISSISKGKGFQGGVKRHNFAGGRRSHGNKHAEREIGSIGAGTTPGRVWKGKKMPGRMGSDRITIKGLTIAKIDVDNNRIFVKGSIAGKPGTLVEISKIDA